MMNFSSNNNNGSSGMGNSNQVAAMMSQMSQMNQMNQMSNMNQNPQMQMNPMNTMNTMNSMNMNSMNTMNNLNLNDLKRLQQLQQQLQNNTPSNPLLVPPSQQQQQDPSAAILQSYLDQKIQTTSFNDSLRTSLGMGGLSGMGSQNPMLGSNLLQERFMMSQNPMGQQGGNLNVNELPLPSPHSLFHRDGSRRMRGGVIEPFPEKLHRLLCEVEAAGRSDVISFVANGRAFAIHKPDKFFKEIVPLYFRQSRLSSFKRQLNLYGFELINTGPARGGYYHELFVKDRPELCRRMRRVAVKVNPKDGSESKEGTSDKIKQEHSESETP